MIEFLKKNQIFKGLDESEIKIILDVIKVKNYREGEVIIKEGEEGEELFILQEGEVEISQSLTLPHKEKSEKVEKTITKLCGKDCGFFGEIGLLEKSTRTATVVARTPTKVLSIDRKNFEIIAQKYPEIGYKVVSNIAKILCSRLRKANENVLKLTTALSIILSR
jgi:CRP-like cAMP-binding protein